MIPTTNCKIVGPTEADLRGRGSLRPIYVDDHQVVIEPMHSSPIGRLGLLTRCGLLRGPALTPCRLEPRQLIGCALVFLVALAICEPARSQKAAPKAAPPPPAAAEPPAPPPEPPAEWASVPVPTDEVRAYLWNVYKRSPAKADGHGDFTRKDITAAARIGLSVEEYVIGGIDPDFREVLYAAGHAMDAAGVEWTILSGFRDDFRQKMASGLKARVNNSFHGGSLATGGYRHGCAVDLASADRLDDSKVWRWVDKNGRDLALHRPLKAADPAHIIPQPGWHEIGVMLRNQRLGITPEVDAVPATLGDLVTVEQYLCVRPLPLPPPPDAAAGTEAADTGRNAAANFATSHAGRREANPKGAKPSGVRETQAARPARTTQAAPGTLREDRARPQ
jgi:hypothetical protein